MLATELGLSTLHQWLNSYKQCQILCEAYLKLVLKVMINLT